MIICLFSRQKASCKVSHGIPHRDEPGHGSREENGQQVEHVNAYGIGFDNEVALASAKFENARVLLHKAENGAQHNAYEGAAKGDEPAFEQKDACYLGSCGSQVAQGLGVILLVDDEHGNGAYDVEASHEGDKSEEGIGKNFLDAHDSESLFLLFHSVEHAKFFACQFLELALHAVFFGLWRESQFERGNLPGAFVELSHELQGHNEHAVVVFALVHLEAHPGRNNVVDVEALDGVAQVDAFALSRCADLERTIVDGSKLAGQSYARGAVAEVGGTQLESFGVGAGAIDDGGDVGGLGVVVGHAFESHHEGVALKEDKSLLGEAFCGRGHIFVTSDALQGRMGRRYEFFALGHYYELRVDGGVEAFDEVAKAIEACQYAHHGHGGQSHPTGRNGRNDVDGAQSLLGKQIAQGNEARKGHG